MGKTRDLFKKIRDMKGIFHANMGSIKDRNGMDLTEAEDIKKRWQEYTEKLYKKDLQDPDNHNGVITHLEPDFLKCEVKWAIESITTNKAGYFFLLWLHPFILSGVISPLISSSILGTYLPGEFFFQYPIILLFHNIHGVFKARKLKWFAIPFSSGLHLSDLFTMTFPSRVAPHSMA